MKISRYKNILYCKDKLSNELKQLEGLLLDKNKISKLLEDINFIWQYGYYNRDYDEEIETANIIWSLTDLIEKNTHYVVNKIVLNDKNSRINYIVINNYHDEQVKYSFEDIYDELDKINREKKNNEFTGQRPHIGGF